MIKDDLKEIISKYLDNNLSIPIGFSSCLIGTKCGWDGVDYIMEIVEKIFKSNKVSPVHFCPEHFSFGTPREFSSIYGGTGEDVLDGKAKVITVTGNDWTHGSIKAANETLRIFKEKNVLLSIMTEISPSCGSHAIYTGNPDNKVYIKGSGVTSALLQRNGVIVIGQRDFKTLNYLLSLIDENFIPDDNAIDFNEDKWYTTYF